MKINSIAISNLYSFPPIVDFESKLKDNPTIAFNDDLNILIGPNGSGKSNFMEIVNEIFIETFIGSQEILQYTPSRPVGYDSLRKNPNRHNNHKDNSASMLIKIELSEIDKNNLITIIENSDKPELHKLVVHPFKGYNEISTLDDWIMKIKKSKDIKDIPTELNYFFDMDTKKSAGSSINITLVEYFIYYCLIHFQPIRKIVDKINIDNKKDWYPLQDTFVLIRSMRKYDLNSQIVYSNRIPIIQNLQSKDSPNQIPNELQSDNLLETVLSKWGEIIRKQRNHAGINSAQEEISRHITNISDILKEAIGLSIKIKVLENDTANLEIYDNGESVEYNSLSTGQKSIFYLIFAIYGLELENALLLIDEPELHLHPALQKKYLKLLKKASKERNLQIILSTHSPVFIDEETIKNTFRFYKEDDGTKIIVPDKIEQKDKELLQILTYTNSARIFFANKVILVEGESDEYFFKFFYENYFIEKSSDIKDAVEIIHIGGKKNVEKWQKFLKKFEIKNYFIGDLDNIQEQGIVSKANYDSMIKQGKEVILEKMKEKLKDRTSGDGKATLEALDKLISNNFEINEEAKSELISLWEYLLGRYASGALEQYFNNYPSKYEEVKNKIDEKYDGGIYILKQGDLEAYIGKSKDKLQNVIEFCQNDNFEGKIDDEKLEELKTIFKRILKS